MPPDVKAALLRTTLGIDYIRATRPPATERTMHHPCSGRPWLLAFAFRLTYVSWTGPSGDRGSAPEAIEEIGPAPEC